MSHITQLRTDVETKISQLHPTCSIDDVKEYFELTHNHALNVLSRLRSAQNLLTNTVVGKCIDYILTNTDNLIGDLSLIESCGLNNHVNNASRYMYATNALATRADNLYRQSSFSNYLRYTFLNKRPHTDLLKPKEEFNYAANIDEIA